MLDEDGQPLEPQAELQDPTTVLDTTPTAWWDDAWESVELAGDPPKPAGHRPTQIDGTQEGHRRRGQCRGDPRGTVIDPTDLAAVAASSVARRARIHDVAHRCPCGLPDVVTTEPRLPDGTPFPTTFYLTCPRAASRIGTLEGSGLMREMEARLGEDAELAAAYARRTSATSRPRAALGDVPEIAGISAGGMPDRVKCLHVLAAQSLAQGRGVNPLGDEVLDPLGEWWTSRALRAGGRVTTVAAIDCGTNTIKLLIGDLPDVAVRETRIVRLGQGVDATGRLADEALERAFAALDEYAALVVEHGVTRIRFCATSATRDAENAEVFVEGVRDRLGVDARGAVRRGGGRALLRRRRPAPAPGARPAGARGRHRRRLDRADPWRVTRPAPPSAAHSMDIGSVRLHERHLRSDPPTMAEVNACVGDIERHLDACPVSPARAATVVGVAGTVTSVAAGVLDLPAYDRDAVDQAVLPVDDVHAHGRPAGRHDRGRAARRCPGCTPAGPTSSTPAR